MDEEILYRVLSELDKRKANWQAQKTVTDIIKKTGEPKFADFYMKMEENGLIKISETHYALVNISEKGELMLATYNKKKQSERNNSRWIKATFVVALIGVSELFGRSNEVMTHLMPPYSHIHKSKRP